MKVINYILLICFISLCTCCDNSEKTSSDPNSYDNGSEGSSNLVVMSYNIRHCAPYYGTSETTVADVEGTAAVIKRMSPDVVMLQEVDKCTTRSLGIDQAQKLAKLAGYPYYQFFKLMDYRDGEYGLAILSKLQLNDAATYLIPATIGNVTVQSPIVVGRAVIRYQGIDINLIDVHLSVYQADRDVQLPYIGNEILSKISNPVIIAGDFNATPTNTTISQLDGFGFTRTNTDAKKFTIDSNSPDREIDYIAYRPANRFSLVSHTVVTGVNASDHLPIIAVLNINTTL